MAGYIDMDTDAKSLAYPQDSRIGLRPLAVWKRLLVSAHYLTLSYHIIYI